MTTRSVRDPRVLLAAALLLGVLAACGPKSGAPGDSRTHSVDPSGNSVIESGAPDMPEDP
ncbi:hypothetical protein [Streptomyces sp. NPDC094032]|uniref:hypothetical protein n=1 Tax=Streptomyces sp. NPDC094032 TaxID=3155308 RepID=UPI003317CF32